MKTKFAKNKFKTFTFPGYELKVNAETQCAFLKRNDRARGLLLTSLDYVDCAAFIGLAQQTLANRPKMLGKAVKAFYDWKASKMQPVDFINAIR